MRKTAGEDPQLVAVTTWHFAGTVPMVVNLHECVSVKDHRLVAARTYQGMNDLFGIASFTLPRDRIRISSGSSIELARSSSPQGVGMLSLASSSCSKVRLWKHLSGIVTKDPPTGFTSRTSSIWRPAAHSFRTAGQGIRHGLGIVDRYQSPGKLKGVSMVSKHPDSWDQCFRPTANSSTARGQCLLT
jgi:hypothetical protein